MVMDNVRRKMWHIRKRFSDAMNHAGPRGSGLFKTRKITTDQPPEELSGPEPMVEQGRRSGLLGAELEAVRRQLTAVRDSACEACQQADSQSTLLNELNRRVGVLEAESAVLEAADEQVRAHVREMEQRWHQETVDRLAALLPLIPAQTDYSPILGSVPLKEVLGRIKDPLFTLELAEKHDGYRHLNLKSLRSLAKKLYRMGYLQHSHHVLRRVATASSKLNDELVLAISRSELEVMSGAYVPAMPAVNGTSFAVRQGRVLHVVGKAIAETQTGYTLRTHYLARAMKDEGWEIGIFRQSGGVAEPYESEFAELDGIDYFLPQGDMRGEVPWTDWLDQNVEALTEVVSRYQPSGLHAHSDFLNFLIAKPVADAFDIPVIYESRGFWEESWLSRAEDAQGPNFKMQIARYGVPESYAWRRDREDDARHGAAVVTTLARVMREHIEQRGLGAEGVHVAPNGVDPEEFPVVSVDRELKEELGIAPGTTVIGYITSVVEYEGIDVLIRAFQSLATDRPDLHLLIVGDGPVRRRLEKYAEQLGLGDRVLFTGRIPHEDVLRYYSLIDIFVVPRRPTTVCQLVTPLKPFEAFSTGRTVVVSDVRALKEIADDSDAALTFEAGNSVALSQVLERLLDDEKLRRDLAHRGAEWVRAERSWRSIAKMYEAPYHQVGIHVQKSGR